MRIGRRLGLLLGLWLACVGAVLGQALQAVPTLSAHVTDTLGLLPAERRDAIEAQLVQLEREKGAQVAVLVVATTQPEAIEAYALRVAEAWRLGRKGVDDGLLFVIARDDRRMRIEVGRGLEGAVTDADSKRIIADVVAPYFKAGDFPAGIAAGVDAIALRVRGEALPEPSGTPAGAADAGDGDILLVGIVATLALGGFLRVLFGRFAGSAIAGGLVGVGAWVVSGALLIGVACGLVAFILLLGMGAGGGGPWVSGGGGWSGGGGGGWSGGGGGFSGGGASGSW